MKTKLKTMTLGDTHGNMSAVYCKGHVSAKVFNQAFKNEGWSDAGYKQENLEYIYCIFKIGKEDKDGFSKVKIKRCAPDKEGAEKYTYTRWD